MPRLCAQLDRLFCQFLGLVGLAARREHVRQEQPRVEQLAQQLSIRLCRIGDRIQLLNGLLQACFGIACAVEIP